MFLFVLCNTLYESVRVCARFCVELLRLDMDMDMDMDMHPVYGLDGLDVTI